MLQRLPQSTDVINRCSVGLTGECSCWKTNSLDNCTDVHQYLASVHPVYRFCLSCWVHCIDVFNFPGVGSTGVNKTPRRAPSQCTDVCNFLSVGSTGDTKISLSWLFWLGFFTVSSIFESFGTTVGAALWALLRLFFLCHLLNLKAWEWLSQQSY